MEEEIKLLIARNAELRHGAAERLSQTEFTENLVLNSRTFGVLLEQAEQMAQDYAKLKNKYALAESKYKELNKKHELELKEVFIQERKYLEQMMEEITTSVRMDSKKQEGAEEMVVTPEADKYYKDSLELYKVQIESLEKDLMQFRKQLETLKKDRDVKVTAIDKMVEDIHKSESRDSEKVKKLIDLYQQKVLELENEKQMSEMWISELEVASRAYDQEKERNKALSQEVLLPQ